jgi:hypothetical protein
MAAAAEEALKSNYRYNMIFNNTSTNNDDDDVKFNTNLISDFDLQNFDPKRYEYYVNLLKVFNNDPDTLSKLLNKYNSIKTLKGKERKIIREISNYVNKLKDIEGNARAAPQVGGGDNSELNGKKKRALKLYESVDKLSTEATEATEATDDFKAAIETFKRDILRFIEDLKTEQILKNYSLNDNTINAFQESVDTFKNEIEKYNNSKQNGGLLLKDILIENSAEIGAAAETDATAAAAGAAAGITAKTTKAAVAAAAAAAKKKNNFIKEAKRLAGEATKLIKYTQDANRNMEAKIYGDKSGIRELLKILDEGNKKDDEEKAKDNEIKKREKVREEREKVRQDTEGLLADNIEKRENVIDNERNLIVNSDDSNRSDGSVGRFRSDGSVGRFRSDGSVGRFRSFDSAERYDSAGSFDSDESVGSYGLGNRSAWRFRNDGSDKPEEGERQQNSFLRNAFVDEAAKKSISLLLEEAEIIDTNSRNETKPVRTLKLERQPAPQGTNVVMRGLIDNLKETLAIAAIAPREKQTKALPAQSGGAADEYNDDTLKARYLEARPQRYSRITLDDPKIEKLRNANKERSDSGDSGNSGEDTGAVKTDNKIEQLSNDIDVYNGLSSADKDNPIKNKEMIQKIKRFEDDPKNPLEELELTFDDRIVFIIATFFIRYITIIMVQWCIDINIIKTFYEGFIYYAVIYIILFWFIVLFINIDNSFDVKYMNFNGIINSIRTLFYYFYMGTNGISRLLIHTSLILLLIVIPIILNIKKSNEYKPEDERDGVKILDFEERKQLSKALSLFTMFIWLFTSIIATKF